MKHAVMLIVAALTALAACAVPSCGPTMPPPGVESGGAGPERVAGGIRFTYYAPKAKRVVIAGDFNNWSTSADPLFDREGRGIWSIVLPLGAGKYEYKFLVDGEKWTIDPRNAERVKDGFGGYNSVVIVAP